jgi:endonuclease/exonuclease/phosphatase family metal-dependent hydrolase
MELKIISYNIHMGLETEALTKNIMEFAKQGVDVFCLQEFWKWMQPVDLETLLLEALGPEWQIEYETPEKPSHDYGVCFLWNKSALKALSFHRLPMPKVAKPKLWEKAWIRAHGFNTFNTQRGALIGTFNWNGQQVRITNLHLDWQGGVRQRAAQISHIKDFLTGNPKADYEIICGDFNTIGIFNKKKQPKMFIGILGDGFYDACSKPEPTCPPFILDHIFVKNFQVQEFQTHKLAGSDHYPVFARLKGIVSRPN